MSLDINRGKARNIIAVRELIDTLKTLQVNGTFYIGYPTIPLADESITIDGLLVANNLKLVVFHIPQIEEVDLTTSKGLEKLQDKQDHLFNAVENYLGIHKALRKRRKLAVEVNVVSYIADATKLSAEFEVVVATKNTLKDVLEECEATELEYIPAVNAAIQKVTTIKPVKKRNCVKKANSKGAILKEIEKETANLDYWQRQAAIETPDGPQRVRGLAGSGKTIVLAWKAAYLHAQYPQWRIAVTFYTRSQYPQFKDLIRRFTYAQSKDEPNWDKLRVLHAWGSRGQEGLYLEIANRLDYPARDFNYGKAKYGYHWAFEGICNELIPILQNREVPPLYDAILIDEAQDLPISFFQILHPFLTQEKRVVWVYDELQNLTTHNKVPPPEQLFGQDQAGNPNVRLASSEDEAHQDIILPICYRNTPWALTAAHALGFGIYRKEGLVQLFDDDALWRDIGYKLLGGQFQPNTSIVLERGENSYPEFFKKWFSPDESISCHCFNDFDQEINWIADQVLKNLQEDELEPDDILIILPDVMTAKTKANQIILALRGRGIQAHLAGVSSSVDELFKSDSVAIAHIHRAKGNEAPIVYIANSEYCASGHGLTKLRNGLFTAITRSRAWVRLCGCGAEMNKIKAEFDALKLQKFSLSFTLPDKAERQKLRIINRERTAAEKAELKRATDGLKNFIELVEKKEMDINTLPLGVRERLEQIIGGMAF